MAQALKILLDEKKVESIKKALGGDKMEMRVVFNDLTGESGEVTKTALAQGLEAFARATAIDPDVPALIPTIQPMKEDKKTGQQVPDGDPVVDSDAFAGMNVAVAVVGARVKNDATKKMESGIRAIVMFPIPPVSSFLESDNGSDWIAKVIEKEAAHVAFRGLRNAETVEELVSEFDAMPRDVDGFVTESTRQGTASSETFDEIWPKVRIQIKQDAPLLAEHLPVKAEIVRAIRSKSAAMQIHAAFEQRGIFAWLASTVIEFAAAAVDEKTGEPAPLDTTIIEGWLAGRDSLDLARAEKAELTDDALDAIAGKFGL